MCVLMCACLCVCACVCACRNDLKNLPLDPLNCNKRMAWLNKNYHTLMLAVVAAIRVAHTQLAEHVAERVQARQKTAEDGEGTEGVALTAEQHEALAAERTAHLGVLVEMVMQAEVRDLILAARRRRNRGKMGAVPDSYHGVPSLLMPRLVAEAGVLAPADALRASGAADFSANGPCFIRPSRPAGKAGVAPHRLLIGPGFAPHALGAVHDLSSATTGLSAGSAVRAMQMPSSMPLTLGAVCAMDLLRSLLVHQSVRALTAKGKVAQEATEGAAQLATRFSEDDLKLALKALRALGWLGPGQGGTTGWQLTPQFHHHLSGEGDQPKAVSLVPGARAVHGFLARLLGLPCAPPPGCAPQLVWMRGRRGPPAAAAAIAATAEEVEGGEGVKEAQQGEGEGEGEGREEGDKGHETEEGDQMAKEILSDVWHGQDQVPCALGEGGASEGDVEGVGAASTTPSVTLDLFAPGVSVPSELVAAVLPCMAQGNLSVQVEGVVMAGAALTGGGGGLGPDPVLPTMRLRLTQHKALQVLRQQAQGRDVCMRDQGQEQEEAAASAQLPGPPAAAAAAVAGALAVDPDHFMELPPPEAWLPEGVVPSELAGDKERRTAALGAAESVADSMVGEDGADDGAPALPCSSSSVRALMDALDAAGMLGLSMQEAAQKLAAGGGQSAADVADADADQQGAGDSSAGNNKASAPTAPASREAVRAVCRPAAVLLVHGLVRAVRGYNEGRLVASHHSQHLVAVAKPGGGVEAMAEDVGEGDKGQQGGKEAVGTNVAGRQGQGALKEVLLAPWLDAHGRTNAPFLRALTQRAHLATERTPGECAYQKGGPLLRGCQ